MRKRQDRLPAMTTTRTSTATPRAASRVGLQLDYLSSDEIACQSSSWWQNGLGIVGFEKLPAIDRARVPITASMTPSLGVIDNLCEVWRVAGAEGRMSNGAAERSRVHYRFCDELLFGSITIEERAVEAEGPMADRVGGSADGESGALLRATELAYQEIFALLKETDHRHLIRIWNYLPEINREAGGDERYRLFNSARQLAFRNSGQATVGTVPAASALGSPAGSPISIYFLAARQRPKMIENPRQTSAYHYPPKFGRHSPIFSRACVWGEPGRSKLFISGTASIVGHESIHGGDVEAQTRETLVNISSLVAEANRIVGAPRYSPQNLMLKVYVRNASDLPAVKATLAERLGTVAGIVFLQADVCREDLLVEIEAVG